MTLSGAHQQGRPASEQAAGAPVGAAVPDPTTEQAVTGIPSTAVATAATAASAAVAAAQVAVARSAVTAYVPPAPPPDGPTDQTEPDPVGTPTVRAALGLPRLRIGYHVASEAALASFSLNLSVPGLLLGPDIDKRLTSIGMFRAAPVRVTVIGGPWLSRLLLFRVLALGARVAIMSAQPEMWHGLGEWATGRSDRVAVLPLDRPVLPPATATEPGLVVWDAGPVAPPAPVGLGPWQTQLTMMTQLTPYGLPALQDAGLVITQRLSAGEAEQAAGALLLDRETTRFLQLLEENMVALLAPGVPVRYVWLTPSGAEQQHLGRPRR